MRTHLVCLGNAARWCLGVFCLASASIAALPALGNEGATTSPEALVAAAQQAQLEGNAARSFALLREAVRRDPQYSLARWHLGQVQYGGEWLAVEEAQRRAVANPKQAQYQELRRAHGETPEGQLALARWCRKHGLADEALVHWVAVLTVDPDNREALRSAGKHWHEGQLRSRDEIVQAKREVVVAQRTGRHWKAVIGNWQRALSSNDASKVRAALAEIRGLSDPAAISCVEQATLNTNPSTSAENTVCRQLSLAFLDSLNAMPDLRATQSLIRYGVLSSWDDVHTASIEHLRRRPLHDFVPILLDELRLPIETSVQVVRNESGSVQFLHSMYREGLFADWAHSTSLAVHRRGDPQLIVARLAGDQRSLATIDRRRANAVVNFYAAIASQRFQNDLIAAERQVAQSNLAAELLNTRIVAVLRGTTDQSLGSEPRSWWNWWQEYNEYDYPETRPVYETEYATQRYFTPRGVSCFASGTLVWTKTGQRPIESLDLGELVLAQNVDTGELAYRPISGRTVRPPSEIVEVSFDDETIRTTLGHPFWVAGVGWRMAKEIEDGGILHSIAGATRVNKIAKSGEEEAYNLIVADFNTYFVGESGVLVHDNTPREPTRTSSPGLAAK